MEQTPKRTLRSSANFVLLPSDLEFTTGISKTVPDMTIDLRTMINRRANGMTVPTHSLGYSDDDLPDLDKMDTVEILQYRTENAAQIEKLMADQHLATKKLEALQKQQADERRQQLNKDPDSDPKA